MGLIEEINKSWVGVKEQGNKKFLDESTIVVYKPGYVPSNVLEDHECGELPDDILQVHRAAMIKLKNGQRRILKIERERLICELHQSKKRKGDLNVLNKNKK